MDRRLDDFRAINAIALRQQIVSGLESGREFFHFLALFDRRALPSQISCSSRAPVAQLDRASDYGSEGLRFESPRARHSFRALLPLYCPKNIELTGQTALDHSNLIYMKLYILDAPLTPPKDTSDASERLLVLVKTCREIIADGKVTAEEAEALRRWLSAAGWLKKFWPANAIAGRINRLLEPLPTEQQLQDLGSFLAEVVQASNLEESADEPDELIDDPELQEVRERTKLFDDPVPEIIFAGRTFCLTGIFLLWMAC